MFKKDCFAFVNETTCFALREINCNGCGFYKHSDNPHQDQLILMDEINLCNRTKKAKKS